MGNDNNLVEVVGVENSGDEEARSLSVGRGMSYPTADWEYLVGGVTTWKA